MEPIKIVTVRSERLALSTCDGLEENFDGSFFAVQRPAGALDWKILLTSCQRQPSERLLSAMQQFALGYITALRKHT